MLRFKSFNILYDVLRYASRSNENVYFFWLCFVHRKLLALVKRPRHVISVPVLYQLGFFRKPNEQQSFSKQLKAADQYYEEVNYEIAESVLTHLLKEYATASEEILWRLARLKYEFSKTASKGEKPKLLEEALELLKKAVSINPQNGYAHKWLAVILDSLSSTKGITERIELALQVRDHLLEALKYIPKDGTTNYILGVWYYTIADFTWYERKIASTLNSKFPSTTVHQALECFKQAEVVEPGFYSRNYLFLGKCYMKLKDNEKATEFLIKARDYPQKTTEDKETNDEAVKLLHKLGVN